MDPTDIYTLADQAGLGYNSGPAATPSYADSQGFTDEDILAHFVPQEAQDEQPAILQEGPQLTPPSPPGLSDLASPAAPLNPGERMKAGGSVSHSGYSDSTSNKIRKGPGAQLKSDIAGIEQQGEDLAKQRQQPFVEAAQSEKDAAHEEAVATADYATAEGHQKAILAKLQQDYDTHTESVIAEQQTLAAQQKAKYVAALNDFRAARVNPAQLWGNMGGFDQVGMLASAFVQDFLGAKGINTSAMATFNKAIDRNIDAQVNAIKVKGQVAEGFKTLWDMQMAESHSVEEARTRMRGFMLDSAKTQIEANMAQFTAALATAKGRAAIAKIDQELAKNLADVSKHVDTVTASRIQQAVQIYGDNLRASMESARIAADKEIAANRLAAEKGAVDPYAALIPDNSESGGGRFIARFKDPKNTTLNNKYLELQASTDNTLKLIRQYRELQRLHGKNQGLLAGTRWGKAEDQQLKTIASEILGNRLLEKSGKAATNEERKALSIGTPQALFGGSLDIASTLALTENIERQQLDSFRHTVAYDLASDDPLRNVSVGTGAYGEVEKKEASAIASGSDKKKDMAEKLLDGQLQDLEEKTAYKPLDEVGADVQAEHKKFIAEHPNFGDVEAGKTKIFYPDGAKTVDSKFDAVEIEDAKKRGLVVREDTRSATSPTKTPPMYFERGLTRMKVDAEKAREQFQEAKTDEDRSEAKHNYEMRIERLKHVASGLVQNPNDQQGLFARQLLGELGVDSGLPLDEPVNDQSQFLYDNTMHEELDPRVQLPPLPKKAK